MNFLWLETILGNFFAFTILRVTPLKFLLLEISVKKNKKDFQFLVVYCTFLQAMQLLWTLCRRIIEIWDITVVLMYSNLKCSQIWHYSM